MSNTAGDLATKSAVCDLYGAMASKICVMDTACGLVVLGGPIVRHPTLNKRYVTDTYVNAWNNIKRTTLN